MIKIKAFMSFAIILCFSSVSIANTKVDKATDILRSLCLAGNGYVVEAKADGSVKIFKKSMSGSVKFTKKELNGVVDVSDNDRKAELDSIRSCIQPHIKQILDAALSKGESIKKKEKGLLNKFLYEDFSSIEEGLVPENWIVAENILIEIRKGKHTLIANPLKEDHKITIPNISFPEDFVINLSAKIQSGGKVEIKLSNNIFLFADGNYSSMIYKINDAKKRIEETFTGQKTIFSIRKEGKVFKIYVNGTKKMVSRISGFEKPEALEINFNDAVKGFEMYEVEGKKFIPVQ